MKNAVVLIGITAFSLAGCMKNEPKPGPAAAVPAPPVLSADITTKDEQQALTPSAVLVDLKAGNERFSSGKPTGRDYIAQVKATAGGQYPKAAVLSCLDSRVPVELVFDQGIGDLFVGRVAGNVEDTDLIGSLEFATAVAGARLVVVLGHSDCGAVKGSIDREAVRKLGMKNLDALLGTIDPAVRASLHSGEERSSKNGELVERTVRENVAMTLNRIREKSPTLKKLEQEGKIRLAGGVYDLQSGKVTWL